MNKAKIIVIGISIISIAGGILASKMKYTNGYIYYKLSYIPVTLGVFCTGKTTGCKYTSGPYTYQLLLFNGISYYAVGPTVK
jgi:hypothetical protein